MADSALSVRLRRSPCTALQTLYLAHLGSLIFQVHLLCFLTMLIFIMQLCAYVSMFLSLVSLCKRIVQVAVRFQPTTTRPVEAKALLTLNNVTLAATEITLRGAGHAPRVIVDVGNAAAGTAGAAATGAGVGGVSSKAIYFRPTCVGATAQRTVTLKNPSRVPVAWQWQVCASNTHIHTCLLVPMVMTNS